MNRIQHDSQGETEDGNIAQSHTPDLTENLVYASRSERANADKPPSRSNPLGAVAASRYPGAKSRREMVKGILAQDADLVAGNFGSVYYKPATVGGVDLKLEPLQPSIGTVVHGIDLATDLNNPEMVSFLRELWLERRVIMFRNQGHLSREQMVAFAQHFGEVGSRYGEREHVPNSPHDLSHPIDVPGFPDMLVLTSDEKVPGAASNWHSDATWQQRPPMASVLMCREAPPIGGDTCFCDCFMMWNIYGVRHLEQVTTFPGYFYPYEAIHRGDRNAALIGLSAMVRSHSAKGWNWFDTFCVCDTSWRGLSRWGRRL